MEKKAYTLNTLLAVVLGVILLAFRVTVTFAPRFILPVFLEIPNLAAVSLLALVLDCYLAPNAKRCWICIPVFAAITFGLLPFAACFVNGLDALKLAGLGCVVFTAMTWLFTSMTDRISTGPAAKLAPIASALGLYLAVQCCMGLF